MTTTYTAELPVSGTVYHLFIKKNADGIYHADSDEILPDASITPDANDVLAIDSDPIATTRKTLKITGIVASIE